jgi:ProP effector
MTSPDSVTFDDLAAALAAVQNATSDAAPDTTVETTPDATPATTSGSANPQGGRKHERKHEPKQERKPERKAPRDPASNPVLQQLAGLYPQLFGAEFLPLKRGIFQDLQAAHPDVFEKDALKVALGLHTRSSRYLTAVAAGLQRHDLQGVAVEAMAPEHVYQSLVEVFRRRQSRTREDLTPKVRARMAQAFEASGLSREAYAALVRGRDESINAVLDSALAAAAERDAKGEAQLRAFEASGQTLEAFADMYGLNPLQAAQTITHAQARRAQMEAVALVQVEAQASLDSEPSAATP